MMNNAMKSKLHEVAVKYADLYRVEIMNHVGEVLDQEYGHSLRTKLTEVMSIGNHLTKDEKGLHSNFLRIYRKRFEELFTNEGIPERAIFTYAKDLENIYLQKTIEKRNSGNIEIPIYKWDRAVIGFYCNQQDYDAALQDLLYFIVVVEFDDWSWIHPAIESGESDFIDSGIVGNALHELSQGVADSLLIRELKDMTTIAQARGQIENEKPVEIIAEVVKPLLQQLRQEWQKDLEQILSQLFLRKKERPQHTTEGNHILSNPNDAHFLILNEVLGVKNFFSRLCDDKLIHEASDYQDFRSVFRYKASNLTKNRTNQPIVWMGTNQELRHLVVTMIRMRIIKPKIGQVERHNPWKVVQCCFVNKDGEQYSTEQLGKTGKLKNGHDKIDALVDTIVGINKSRYVN